MMRSCSLHKPLRSPARPAASFFARERSWHGNPPDEHVDFPKVVAVDFAHVVEDRHVGEARSEHALGERLALDQGDVFDVKALLFKPFGEAGVEPADACEQSRYSDWVSHESVGPLLRVRRYKPIAPSALLVFKDRLDGLGRFVQDAGGRVHLPAHLGVLGVAGALGRCQRGLRACLRHGRCGLRWLQVWPSTQCVA